MLGRICRQFIDKRRAVAMFLSELWELNLCVAKMGDYVVDQNERDRGVK